MSNYCVSSPLNFTGGKYKLLPQILPLFPKKINTFVDIFCGGCNVGINTEAKKVVCNDIDSNIIGLMNFFKNSTYENLKQKIDKLINEYGLSDSCKNGYAYYNCTSSSGLGAYNKNGFLNLRKDFNSMNVTNPDYYLFFYVLIIFSFNNQIRFNSKGNYNLPVGKRDFNLKMQKKLEAFMFNIKKIQFVNSSFESFLPESLNYDDFVYADPPYLITCATYNEKNGWNEELERKLLCYLDSLTKANIKFAMSNVLVSNGKQNNLLLEWINFHPEYKCHHLSYTYKNSNYHKKQISPETDEVLVTNY